MEIQLTLDTVYSLHLTLYTAYTWHCIQLTLDTVYNLHLTMYTAAEVEFENQVILGENPLCVTACDVVVTESFPNNYWNIHSVY